MARAPTAHAATTICSQFGEASVDGGLRQSTTNSISVTLRDFTNDSVSRGFMSTAWFLTSVQFGFEPWQGGPGLGLNSFSFNAS
jgi:hypothetical protein